MIKGISLRSALIFITFSVLQATHASAVTCASPNVLSTGPFGLGQVDLSVSRVAGASSYWMEVYSVNSNGTLNYVGGGTEGPNIIALNLQGGTYKLQYGAHCGSTSSALLEYEFTVSPCAIPTFTSPGPFAAGIVPLTLSPVAGAENYWMEVYEVNSSGTLNYVGGQTENSSPSLAINLSGGNYKIQYGATCAAGSSPLVEQSFEVSSCANPQVISTGPFKAGWVDLAISPEQGASSYWMEVYSVNSNGTYNYIGGQTEGADNLSLNLASGNYMLQYLAQCSFSNTPFQDYFFTVGQ